MRDIPTKVPGSTLTSDEYNSPNDEQKNLVTLSGQALNPGDSEQFTKGISNYVGNADFYNDTGTAVAYSLTTVSTNRAPTTLRDGLRVRFIPANTNSGPATVNVAGLGAKSIKKYGNVTDIEQGDITSGLNVELAYRQSDDIFELITITSPVILQSVNLFPNFSGMNLANNGGSPLTNVDIEPGTFKSKTSRNAFTLSTTVSKDLTMPWMEGTGQGGRASGVPLSPNTCYHVFPIAKVTGEVDMGFDTDINATNLLADANVIAANYTFYRRRGSILTDGSSNIIAFFNNKDMFYWKNSIVEAVPTPSQVPTYSTYQIVNCPIDVSVEVGAAFECEAANVNGDNLFISSTFQTFLGDGLGGGLPSYSFSHVGAGGDSNGRYFALITTDTTASIKVGRVAGVAALSYNIYVVQWRELEL